MKIEDGPAAVIGRVDSIKPLIFHREGAIEQKAESQKTCLKNRVLAVEDYRHRLIDLMDK